MKSLFCASIVVIAFTLVPLTMGCAQNVPKADTASTADAQALKERDVAADVTAVDPSIDYVKVKWLSPVQDKPFPSIYFTYKAIAVNKWILETNVVMVPKDLSLVFNTSKKMSCVPIAEAKDAKFEGLEISWRRAISQVVTCRVRHSRACPYLSALTSEKFAYRKEYDLTWISDLSKQVKCRNNSVGL